VAEDLIAEVEELRGRVARRECELEAQWNAATTEATRRATNNRIYISDQDARLLQMQEEITLLRRTIDELSEGTGSSSASVPEDGKEGASAGEEAGGTGSATGGAEERQSTHSYSSSDSSTSSDSSASSASRH